MYRESLDATGAPVANVESDGDVSRAVTRSAMLPKSPDADGPLPNNGELS